jgi:hypothetical protein
MDKNLVAFVPQWELFSNCNSSITLFLKILKQMIVKIIKSFIFFLLVLSTATGCKKLHKQNNIQLNHPPDSTESIGIGLNKKLYYSDGTDSPGNLILVYNH